jgi:putative ABC transport system permease protein
MKNSWHYISAAFKTIKKHWAYSLLNILGLSIGISLTIIVLLFIKFESNYDTQFYKSNQIYRLASRGLLGSNLINEASTPMPLLPLSLSFDEVESGTRFIPGSNKLISNDSLKFNESLFFFGDSSFFSVFNLTVLSGSLTHFKEPFKVVLTPKTAQRYFGDVPPVGLSLDREGISYEVIAVCSPMPAASHFRFDFMASLSTIDALIADNSEKLASWNNSWLTFNCYTYVRLKDEVDVFALEDSLNHEKNKLILPQIMDALPESRDIGTEVSFRFFFQGIESIHLYSDLDHELEDVSKPIYINIFIFIALFILLVTCVNFINITTAKYTRRFKEVSVKKILGAGRRHLIFQFMTEAIVIAAISAFLGFVLVELILPGFNQLFQIDLQISQIRGFQDILIVVLLVFVVGVISGAYPARYFSVIPVNQIFKGEYRMNRGAIIVRGVIVTSQVLVMLFLGLITASMWWQTSFLNKTDLGFEKENILVLERGHAVGPSWKSFKEDVRQLKGVENVSASMSLPGDQYYYTSFVVGGSGLEDVILLPTNYVDCDYFETMGLRLKKGRFLSCDSGDSLGMVVNISAIKELGLKKPLGARMEVMSSSPDYTWEVTLSGVVADFHFETLNDPIKPLGIMLMGYKSHFSYILIRMTDPKDAATLKEITAIWEKYSDNQPLESFLLSDRIRSLYEEDVRMLKIVGIFTLFSFFMSVLGFISLASFITEYKRKGIAVMQMLGASKQLVFRGVIIPFLGYVIAGVLLAMPLASLAIRAWLHSFAYGEYAPWWMYLLITIVVVAIALFAVLYQFYRTVSRSHN